MIRRVINITDYPITFDNKLFFSFRINEKINILEISIKKEKSPIELVFNDKQFNSAKIEANGIAQEIILNARTKIESLIDSPTKAIIPVHIFGCPVNMESLMKLDEKYNLTLWLILPNLGRVCQVK